MTETTQNSEAEEAAVYYRELLKPVYRGQRHIVIGGPVVGLVGLAASLRKLGAERPFLLGSCIGTGVLPEPEEAEWYSLDHRANSVNEEFRQYEAALRDLPKAAIAALDRFDPERRAKVIGAIVLSEIPGVGGRACYGARRPEWVALEDKVAIEEFWDHADVRRAPSRIVAVDAGALSAASRVIDRGAGCVWAGDAREGVNGGAEYARWVRTDGDAADARRFFAAHCDRVRVMPFLEGVPCSIHGLVFPDRVAVFRPLELVTLRRPDSATFLYCGVATFWDPPAADRETMRETARRVGAVLRERVDFRGPFTIDGVLTDEGFLPTELNPRFGAGLGPISAALPTLPFAQLCLALAEGEDLDYRPEWLESVITDASDRQRYGRSMFFVRHEISEMTTHAIARCDGGYRLAEEGAKADGAFILGPGPLGGFFAFVPDPASIPVGSHFAPFVVEAFAQADRALGTGIGDVEAAQPAR